MPECVNCGKQHSDSDTDSLGFMCKDCYEAAELAARQREAARKAEAAAHAAQQKYPVLRGLIGFYQVLAWICAIAALVAAAVAFLRGEPWHAVSAILVGAVATISCIATAEVLAVLLDTEKNTRNCHSLLLDISQKEK